MTTSFLTHEGMQMRLSNFRNRYWKPALKTAGMEPSFRVHDQRHTAISLWIKAGYYPEGRLSPRWPHFRRIHVGLLWPPLPGQWGCIFACSRRCNRSIPRNLGARLGATKIATHRRHQQDQLNDQGKRVGAAGLEPTTSAV